MKNLLQRIGESMARRLQPIANWLVKNQIGRWTLKYLKVARVWFRKYGLDAALVVAFIAVLSQGSLLIFNQLSPNRPVLGLKFENSPIHHLNDGALMAKIQIVLDTTDQRSVLIRVGKFQAHVTARQLGATHNSRLIEQKILKVGREGSLWQRLIDQDTALFGQRNLKDSFSTINKQLASVYLQHVNSQVQIAPLNASFVYEGQHLSILSGTPGLQINVDQAIAALQSIDPTQSNVDLSLPVDHPAPTVSKQELQPLLAQAEKIVSQPLTIVGGDKQIKLEPAQLAALLAPEKKSDPANPTIQVVSISYDNSKLSSALDQLASQVSVAATPKVVSGQKVISAGTPGVHLDGTHAKIEVITELEKRQLQPNANTKPQTSQSSSSPTTSPAPTSKPSSTTTSPPSSTPTKPTTQAPATVPTTPAKPTTQTPSTTTVATPPTTADTGNSIIVPIDTIDPPVINQTASANPLGRYPATVNGKNTIYLTIDDGPGGYTEPLLDILKRYNVHAIFFLIGKNATAYPQTVKRIQAEGHTIGNHSYTHSDLAKLSQAAVNDELVKTQKTLHDLTGLTPDLFRPPYGSLGPAIYTSTAKNNLNIMMWSIDPRDWSTPGVSVIVKRVVDATAPGGNILLHSTHQQTVDALPSIIEGLRAKGYTLQ